MGHRRGGGACGHGGRAQPIIGSTHPRDPSRRVQLEFDRAHGMGFLGQPKRFNVALTRAMSMLIVVGNPAVLATDDYWRQMLRHALKTGAYVGVPPPSLPDEPLPPPILGAPAAHPLPPRAAGEARVGEQQMHEVDDDGAPMASARMQQEGMEMPVHE